MTIATTSPEALVGQWVRLDRDGGRPPHLGVLTRATPDPDIPGLWHWALRTPTGYMVGGPHLPAELLTCEYPADVARARRALRRQLHTDRAVLADLLAHAEPAGPMARAVAALEELQAALDAQLS
ncbi:hypothetical protein [Nocardiopsis sp. NPDC055824]